MVKLLDQPRPGWSAHAETILSPDGVLSLQGTSHFNPERRAARRSDHPGSEGIREQREFCRVNRHAVQIWHSRAAVLAEASRSLGAIAPRRTCCSTTRGECSQLS